MKWKSRTRTKIITFVLLFLATCIIGVFYGWLFKDKPDAPAMLTALLGGGGLMWVFHVLVIGKENSGALNIIHPGTVNTDHQSDNRD